MKSLIERLDARLVETNDARTWVRLHAQRAAHFARVGNFSEAKKIIESLRGRYASESEGEGIVWVMFAEGLVCFFESYDERAHDRLLRVRLLADAFAIEDIKVLSLAWLIHLEFNRARYETVANLLGEIFHLNVSPDHDAPEFARLALDIGDISAFCGEADLSTFWYAHARQAAFVQGDDATTAAVLYNRPAMSLFAHRLAFVNGYLDPERLRFSALELEAAHGYQFGAKHSAQSQLLFSCQARFHVLAAEYVQASELFRMIFAEDNLLFGFVSDFELLKLEYSYSLAMSGNISEARAHFESVEVALAGQLNSDDEMMFFFLFPKVAALLDIACDEDDCRLRFQASAKRLFSEQSLMKPRLLSISDQLKCKLLDSN